MRTSVRPNILYIMSDQHGRRVLGCYGNKEVRTPSLDGLADRGIVFDAAYCPSPICVPSRMSALTGQWPHQQECWTLRDHLGTHRPTWAHSLGASGYHPVLIGRMHSVGPDQYHGFVRRYAYEPGPHWPGVPRQDLGVLNGTQGPSVASIERSGRGQSAYQLVDEEVCNIACDWIAGVGRERSLDGPFCLMLGFTLPHCPFVARSEDYDLYDGRISPPVLPPPDPVTEHPVLARWRSVCGIDNPDPKAVVRARTAYYGLVTRTDILVGRVLDALDEAKLSENTLVIYTSDHGEQLGEHGHWWKNTFYEDSVAVPLILAWPGWLPEGERRSHIVNLVDIGATLIEAVGAPELPGSNGRSLLDIATDPNGPWVNRTFSEYVTRAEAEWTGPEATRQRMIRDGRWKLVVVDGHRPMLFDLETDPDELNDLAEDPAHEYVRDELETRTRADWDPDAIARRIKERQLEQSILSTWAAKTCPPLHFVRELKAEESWLEAVERCG